MKEISDEELMQQIGNGKTAGLAVLFDRYQQAYLAAFIESYEEPDL